MIARKLLPIILLSLLTTLSTAQTILRGIVTDASQPATPIAGATITVINMTTGTTTDSTGRFVLRTDKPVSAVRVSFVGYQPRTVTVTDPNVVLTIALTPDDGQNLDEVRVSSRYYRTYTTNSISSALRLKTAPINLSQNIQTITPEVIADQGSFNMTEGVSRNVSGVIRQEISNNLGPYLFMRGGLLSSLRNGIDLTPIYRGPSPDDAAIIERVEFIKGPSLFMNNIGDPAGSFNIVTKQPTGTRRYTATAMLGSFDFYRLAVDLDGKFDRKGRLLYRLNAVGTRTNSFVKFDYNRRFLVAPVLKYRISDRTYVSAEYQYQANNYAMYSPIVMTPGGFGTLPIDFSITEPSLPPIRARDHSGFLTFAHQFNTNWQLTVRGAFMRNDAEGVYMWVTGVNAANPNVLLRNPKYDLNRTEVYSQQAFVNGTVTTGAVRHQLLTGIDVNQKRFRADSYVSYDTYKDAKGTTQYYPLDVTNPNYGAEIPAYHTPGGLSNGNTSQRISYASAYALDELSLLDNKLRLTVAGRLTAVRTGNDVSGVHTESTDQVVTPRLGISYSLHPDLTVYALYDRTFVPQAGVTSSGEAIRPLQGVNREIGIKKNWFGGRLSSTLSVYRIDRSNSIATDPSNAQYRIQVGQSRSQGVDVDVVGQVARGLNVVVNYAFCDSKIVQDVNPLLIGTPTPMAVRQVQNTWLNYALPARVVPGLNLSLGYQYQGGRGERFATATQHDTPDYFRLDGGVGWQRRSLRVNLIVNNLLNRQLIATPWYRNGLYYWVPQSPINGRLTVSYAF